MMEDAAEVISWPEDNLYICCYTHRLFNYRYHWHISEVELDIILHGSAEFRNGTEKFLLKEDDVVLVNPGAGHATYSQEENTVALVLRFSTRAFKPYLKSGEGFRFPTLKSETDEKDEKLLRMIRYLSSKIYLGIHGDGQFDNLIGKASAELLIAELCSRCEIEKIPAPSQIDSAQYQGTVKTIIEYIEEHYSEKISLEEVSKLANYNRTYVSTLFKDTVGINFYDYLMRFRLRMALLDLSGTDKSLTEIALDNGFSDLKSFNQRFKEIFKTTPSEYRASLEGKNVMKMDWFRDYVDKDDPLVAGALQRYLDV